jgi:hypothetical protein
VRFCGSLPSFAPISVRNLADCLPIPDHYQRGMRVRFHVCKESNPEQLDEPGHSLFLSAHSRSAVPPGLGSVVGSFPELTSGANGWRPCRTGFGLFCNEPAVRADFCRPYGTWSFVTGYPVLKRWAKFATSLRDWVSGCFVTNQPSAMISVAPTGLGRSSLATQR